MSTALQALALIPVVGGAMLVAIDCSVAAGEAVYRRWLRPWPAAAATVACGALWCVALAVVIVGLLG